MRTNIVIDDKMMRKAMISSGLHTKKQVVEEALRVFVGLTDQAKLKKLRGKLKWSGDLEAMRTGK